MEARDSRHGDYWRRNVRIVLGLLFVWFIASYGFGIIWAEALDQVRIPGTGFPLGFWFAQQGSIYVFMVLIFVYVWRMNRLDDEYGVAEVDHIDVPTPPSKALDATDAGAGAADADTLGGAP